MYPVVFFDALRVKIRDEGSVKNKAVYLALGIQRDGTKDVLGLWIQQTEGAKFWLAVMNELKNRGLQDILIAVIDGLRGFSEAITAVFPETAKRPAFAHPETRANRDGLLTTILPPISCLPSCNS
jgi:putative transposase